MIPWGDILARIDDEEPGALATAVIGSYARGDATPSSDLDLYAVYSSQPATAYRTWFFGDLHVSIAFVGLGELRAALARPSRWSLGLPSEIAARWLRGELDVDWRQPGAEPELEDFVEYCAKALRATDPLDLRIAARGMGEEAPALLRELNEPVLARTRFDAVRLAAGFALAPPGWTGDLVVLLGLGPATDDEVRQSVERLGRGVLRLLRERGATFEQPELNTYLADGTLERHLAFG